LGIISLTPHPDFPPKSVDDVEVDFQFDDEGSVWLEYRVASKAGIALPASADPAPADDLWKTTCFEMFVRYDGEDSYREYNFSPSYQWAAYAFDTYREGMEAFDIDDPQIVVFRDIPSQFWLTVEYVTEIADAPGAIGLSAVIEEKDGTKSYWAIKHPAGAPDFHHADCFALTVEAPEAA
jgi:hypothetical protein